MTNYSIDGLSEQISKLANNSNLSRRDFLSAAGVLAAFITGCSNINMGSGIKTAEPRINKPVLLGDLKKEELESIFKQVNKDAVSPLAKTSIKSGGYFQEMSPVYKDLFQNIKDDHIKKALGYNPANFPPKEPTKLDILEGSYWVPDSKAIKYYWDNGRIPSSDLLKSLTKGEKNNALKKKYNQSSFVGGSQISLKDGSVFVPTGNGGLIELLAYSNQKRLLNAIKDTKFKSAMNYRFKFGSNTLIDTDIYDATPKGQNIFPLIETGYDGLSIEAIVVNDEKIKDYETKKRIVSHMHKDSAKLLFLANAGAGLLVGIYNPALGVLEFLVGAYQTNQFADVVEFKQKTYLPRTMNLNDVIGMTQSKHGHTEVVQGLYNADKAIIGLAVHNIPNGEKNGVNNHVYSNKIIVEEKNRYGPYLFANVLNAAALIGLTEFGKRLADESVYVVNSVGVGGHRGPGAPLNR